MPAGERNWTDQKIGRMIGTLLWVGVLIAAAVVFAGGIVYLVQTGSAMPEFHTFHGEPGNLRAVSKIVDSAFSLDGRGIIQLGIVVLLVTPIARVILSFFLFLLQRDYTYILVTLIVLSVLLYSLTGGGV
jgi:uncharacterized membrane protein